jgi:hypothetical protein
MVYYDGRAIDKVDELAQVLLNRGLIPKYAADGTISSTGRTYKYTFEDEELVAKKKDDVASALRECPKMQNYFIEMLKSGKLDDETPVYESEADMDSDLTDEEFEEKMKQEIEELEKGGNEAEEISGSWDDI